MKMPITTAAQTPITAVVSEQARRLAGATLLTATVTTLGTVLVPLLAIATALAWPVLPIIAAIAGRERPTG